MHNPGIELHEYTVMPDHVHMNLHIQQGLQEPLKSLGMSIRGFKAYTTQRFRALGCKGTLWQKGYHDHLCPGRAKIEATARYIRGNPLKWELMYGLGALRVIEPLDSPFLNPADFWRGVGEIGLLDSGNKLVSARISRAITKNALKEALARLAKAVDQGFIIISHFASPGEHELRDMLVVRKDARFIVACESQIPYGYKPDSRLLEPISRHRCLIIGRGNEEGDFNRLACLDVNAEIKRMALASGGFATYWKVEGPEIER